MSLSGEPIVILGSYRSGTSSMAATLAHLGLFLGSPEALFPADEFNPDGHWELKEMMAVHERLLMALRSSYYPATWLPENWQEHPLREEMIRDLRALLEKNFRGKALWGWKEPSTSILLPLYKEALAQEGLSGSYLICVRHPKAVVASMLKRFVATPLETVNSGALEYPGAEERLMAMWLAYTLAALVETKGRRRLLVSFDRYLVEPHRYIASIAGLLPSPPAESQLEAARAAVKPKLSHSSFAVDERLEDWPEIVNDVYALCLRIDADPEGFQNGDYDAEIDGFWRAWLRDRRMVNPITLPSGQMTFLWEEQGQPGKYSEGYVPTFEGDLMRFEAKAPAGTEIRIDFFQTPCQIWIKKAEWIDEEEEGKRAVLHAGPGGILEQIGGAQRLTVFGPHSLTARTPESGGPFSFEVDILLQYDPAALTRVIGLLAKRANR